MKSWIPDSRNFAYLNWKQVDALPRDKTLLVLPTAAIEQHGPIFRWPRIRSSVVLLLGARWSVAAGTADLCAALGVLRQEQ